MRKGKDVMLDFDEEAKRILKSERERASEDAKRAAGLAAWVFGLILILLLAWQVIQSIFFGAHFSWFILIFLLGIYTFALVAGRIDVRFSASRDMRDSRLVRIELKLDRLIDLSDETPERLKEHISEERESPTRERNWGAYLRADQRIREQNRDGG
jgi:hypothetical protein